MQCSLLRMERYNKKYYNGKNWKSGTKNQSQSKNFNSFYLTDSYTDISTNHIQSSKNLITFLSSKYFNYSSSMCFSTRTFIITATLKKCFSRGPSNLNMIIDYQIIHLKEKEKKNPNNKSNIKKQKNTMKITHTLNRRSPNNSTELCRIRQLSLNIPSSTAGSSKGKELTR